MRWVILLGLLAATLAFALLAFRPPQLSSAPLAREVYIWQRLHTTAVTDALSTHGPEFSRVVVLAAQVQWQGETPDVTFVDLDYPVLAAVSARGTQIGLAIRIDEFTGRFAGDSAAGICSIADRLIASAAPHITISEIQLDFDCPTRRLGDYRLWIAELRKQVHCPLTITALPTWLGSSTFGELARETDGFVLQVHSLDKPKSSSGPASLCNLEAARTAVAIAARLNVPFRVALPTYGYVAAFDESDRFVGLSAEGPAPSWPESFTRREIRANPSEIADLVNDLRASHPASLSGLIFYRLPVATDRLNWAYPTLAAVMRGKRPRHNLQMVLRPDESGATDLVLQNSGNDDAFGPAAVSLSVTGGQILAFDANNGFDINRPEGQLWTWHTDRPFRLAPDGEMTIGWVRVSAGAHLGAALTRD